VPFRSPDNPDAGGVFTAPLVYLSGGEKPHGQDAVPRKASGRPAHEPTEATRREVRRAAARFIPESMQNRGGDYAAAGSAAPSFAGRKPG
jgi:hypothetical protein